MSTKIFVNLPVKDLDKSKAFFGALGYTFNPQFTDATAACMVISEDIYSMLLTEAKFNEFMPKAKTIADARKTTEVMVALSADSRLAVDELCDKAMKAGAGEVARRRITASCMAAASPISTAISGKSSGWIRASSRRAENQNVFLKSKCEPGRFRPGSLCCRREASRRRII